jgi:hypothetical protein
VWGGLRFQFAATRLEPVNVALDALELSCERTQTLLVPCYADLIAAIRDRGAQFHGALTTAFSSLLAAIFVERRVGAPGAPADLVIRSASPRLVSAGNNASLHLDLDASLVAPR